ncbi:MAG TPA: beta-ketoacyl synthase N-terminal-like domain-containing protein, partial [Acidiferrobacteraceae bacterium]|nr:beta-ketoacyl synthase N-terminal-like domain-containing protein [Acidiferrobacteraceae bacterium]
IADQLARSLQLAVPPLTLSTACSSTANALVLGGTALEAAEYPAVLVAGLEALSPVLIEGFRSLMLLDAAGSRPFDRRRDGMHLGEAAAVQCLEPQARSRWRRRGRWLLAGAQVCAATGVAAQAPNADAMYTAMDRALSMAGVDIADVIAVKTHGLGSPDSDLAEARALQRLGGRMPLLTSLKGALGHTLGVSGVLETAVFGACLEAGFIPPAAGFVEPDPELGVQPLTQAVAAQTGIYLLNFFGFGASYVSLVLGWYP